MILQASEMEKLKSKERKRMKSRNAEELRWTGDSSFQARATRSWPFTDPSGRSRQRPDLGGLDSFSLLPLVPLFEVGIGLPVAC